MGDEDHLHARPLSGRKISQTVALQDIERRKHITTNTNIRLKHDLATLKHQEANNLYNLRREERDLKNELKHLQHSSGHLYTQENAQLQDDSSSKEKKGKQKKYRKQEGETLRGEAGSRNQSGMQKLDSTERKTVSQLPPVVQGRSGTQPKIITDDHDADKNEDANQQLFEKQSRLGLEANKSMSDTNVSVTLQPFGDTKKSKSEQFLNNNNNMSWYTNIDTARTNISKRLSTSTGDVRDSSTKPSSSGTDLTPYLYAPPDGLPRTMYMMPNIDERIKQANLARYVRKPGTKLDPIEKELQTDDVFENKQPK